MESLTKSFFLCFRFYPDYYEEIKKPLSVFNVHKKMKVFWLFIKQGPAFAV